MIQPIISVNGHLFRLPPFLAVSSNASKNIGGQVCVEMSFISHFPCDFYVDDFSLATCLSSNGVPSEKCFLITLSQTSPYVILYQHLISSMLIT